MNKIANNSHTEFIWYSPKLDIIIVNPKNFGYLFKNDSGIYHYNYYIGMYPLKFYEFYLIGEL